MIIYADLKWKASWKQDFGIWSSYCTWYGSNDGYSSDEGRLTSYCCIRELMKKKKAELGALKP